MTSQHNDPPENLQTARAEPGQSPGEWSREKILSEILHRIGHDIGNPLTAIISLASIIEYSAARSEGGTDGEGASKQPLLPVEKLHDYAGSIMSEAWKISHIAERMVMMFSDRTGNIAPCSVGETAERAVQRLRSRLRLDDLRIESDFFFAPTAARVLADGDQFSLLISELLLNAYFFQGRPVSPETDRVVRCSLEQEEDFVRLVFENSIPAALQGDLGRLFEPLTSGSDLVGAKASRTGLGLAAVWAIVSRHGGKMSVEQRSDGTGHRFVVNVLLPAAERNGDGA